MTFELQKLKQQNQEFESLVEDLEGDNHALKTLFIQDLNDDKKEINEDVKTRLQKLGLRKRTIVKNRRSTEVVK